MNPIIVFLGPSLSIEKAQNILPQAIYLPPAKCGDVMRVLRLEPSLIAIVDGFFENVPSIWHKEILYAMEKGISVLGSSSMGALRAAELADFGMIGIGKIFEDFRQGRLIDDDEVAILHGPKKMAYRPLTDALVNIRATVKAAVAQGVLNEQKSLLLIQIAKKLFYRDRTLKRILQIAEDQQGEDDLNLFKIWLNQGNHVDQKGLDAIALLNHIKYIEQSSTNYGKKIKTNRSSLFRLLKRHIWCNPLEDNPLPDDHRENIIRFFKMKSGTFTLLHQLTYLLSAVNSLKIPDETHDNFTCYDYFQLKNIMREKNWSYQNDCNRDEKEKFIQRMWKIQQLINYTLGNNYTKKEYLLALIRLKGIYPRYKNLCHNFKISEDVCEILKKISPKKFCIMNYIALLWATVDTQIQALGLTPQIEKLQDYSDEFRNELQLLTQTDTQNWLIDNDLDFTAYNQLISMGTRLKFLISQNCLDVLNVTNDADDIPWLYDAARLTNLYFEIKQSKK